jgi:hypothetical protein
VEIATPDSVFVPIDMEVDSGSDITAVTKSVYERSFSDHALSTVNQNISNFDGTPITHVLGKFTSVIRFANRRYTVPIYVVPNHCSSILGKNAIQGLALIIDGLSTNVRTTRQTYDMLLARYPALTADGIGTFPNFQHSITLSADAKPRAAKLRPVPLSRREGVKKEIERMVEDGIWEKVTKSTWVHNMVSVVKPNGQIRITSDLAALNKFVVPERFPLPCAKDLFLELSGATIYSKLDLKKGYFHVPLDPESRSLTATVTCSGIYQYCRLPMGLCESASVFQRLVAQTLADCEGTIVFIDDILIFAPTMEEHDRRLEQTLKKLSENDFRLNTEKCQFASDTITFLGHEISHNSIKPCPEKIEAITNAPTPCSAKDVQKFLGLVNYYHDFLPNLAAASEPLRRLLRKDVKFSWNNAQDKAFNDLKRQAADNLCVYIFDPTCPTFVTVDACDFGLGAVLSQIQNNKEVPISFASHTLQPHERRYATSEKECLACIWACEKWDKFLLGRKFTLRTDHSALKSLLQEHRNGRQSAKFSRWLTRLQYFDYEIEHHPGKDNLVADALSRLPVPSSEPAITDDTETRVVRHVRQDGISLTEIRQQTKADHTLSEVLKFLNNGWPNRNSLSSELKIYHQVRNELSIEDGYIVRNEDRIVVPPSLQKKLLKLSHLGHPGIVRMKRKVRETYWWPTLNQDIERQVKYCQPCQASGKSAKSETIPEITIPRPDGAWKKLAIDIAGPYYTAPNSQRFIVAIIDYFSKFP